MCAGPILRKEDIGEGSTNSDVIVTIRVCVGHSGDQTIACDFFMWLSRLCRATKPLHFLKWYPASSKKMPVGQNFPKNNIL